MDKDITVVTKYPPNIEKIKKVFDIEGRSVLFAYTPFIFNPLNGRIDEPLRIHELTHMAQQGENGGPEKWWDKYLEDTEFRLEQEVEAYSNQYNSYCTFDKDRNARSNFLVHISKELSSDLYGNLIPYSQAFKLIKDHANRGYPNK